jgi:hypothetical protein
MLAVLIALLLAPAAHASCVASVVVDGTVLYGMDAAGTELPPPAGRVRAVSPACNDAGQGNPDRTTTLVRLAGVPPQVAVRSIDGGVVYLAAGSLTALAAHPLHRESRRFARGDCGRRVQLEGTTRSAFSDGLLLASGARRHAVTVDARTELVNRPAFQPLLEGQRLRIAARHCGRRLVADRIAFTGPTVVAER